MQLLALFIGISLLCVGCRNQDTIETYRVPKEPAPDIAPFSAPTAQSKREISWDTPSGWIEQKPSAMRVGSFLVKGKNGQTADVSVVALSGPSGGSLANINRWRGQIRLDAITQDQLSDNSQKIRPSGRPMLWVDFVSAEKLINNQSKSRLLAAIYTQGDRSWFFKMLGEDQTVQEAKPAFQYFLETLRFHAAD